MNTYIVAVYDLFGIVLLLIVLTVLCIVPVETHDKEKSNKERK